MDFTRPPAHRLDSISLGKIVQIRERLLKTQAAGTKVFRFESGDPDFSIAPHVMKAINDAAAAGKTHYIPNNGIPELRKALAAKIVSKNKFEATADDIFVTNGAMHALYVTFASLLEEGDEVIVPDPMWTEVVENIRLAGGVPAPVTLRASEDFEYRPAAIESAITGRTKAIFLNTPHNPTGALLSKQTLLQILEIAKKHKLWIVSDEAYEDVLYAPYEHHSIASLAGDYAKRVISIFSFSKSHAMSGLRTGYIVTRDPVLHDRLPKILRCTINGVNSLAQWAALAAVQADDSYLNMMRQEYRVRRDIQFEALQGIPGLKPFLPRGSFFTWAETTPELYQRLGVKDADGLSNKLAEAGMGSSPGDAFGLSCVDAIRFSFSCSTQMVREGSAVLRKMLLG
jgi:aspartate aminotransferase